MSSLEPLCAGPGLFRTFEDFEFRARFTDRKNTPTFTAVMVKKLKLPFLPTISPC
jgi:hypothetical protein